MENNKKIANKSNSSRKAKKANNKLILIILLAVVIIVFGVTTLVFINKKKNNPNIDDNPTIDYGDQNDNMFDEKNEVEGYKLEVDEKQTVTDLTFSDFKMKDYISGYQKIEVNIQNVGKTKSKENKRFMIELLNKDGMVVGIADIWVKSLEPNEKIDYATHISGNIKGIVNYRVVEYLLDV